MQIGHMLIKIHFISIIISIKYYYYTLLLLLLLLLLLDMSANFRKSITAWACKLMFWDLLIFLFHQNFSLIKMFVIIVLLLLLLLL